MDKIFNIFNALVVIIAFIVVIGLILAIPTMWLWNNALVGAVNGVNEIDIWQAFGLNILSGIFFRTNGSKE